MGLAFVKGNSNRLIYRFQSPFAEMPCRVQDIDMFVPNEYLTNIHIREKLADIKVLLSQNSCTQNRAASDRQVQRGASVLDILLEPERPHANDGRPRVVQKIMEISHRREDLAHPSPQH